MTPHLPCILGFALAFCIGILLAISCLRTDEDRILAANIASTFSVALLLVLTAMVLFSP